MTNCIMPFPKILIILLLLFGVSGCSKTDDKSKDSELVINCDKKGAVVEVDGEFKGECPLKVIVSPGEHQITLKKPGIGKSYYLYDGKVRVGAGVTQPVNAQLVLTDPDGFEKGKTIFMKGKGDVPACMACHDLDGMGDDAMATPRIVGLDETYLVKQMEDYRLDKILDTTMFIMNTAMKGLSIQDRKLLAIYLASSKPTSAVSDLEEVRIFGIEIGNRTIGKRIYETGTSDGKTPACKKCHASSDNPQAPDIMNQRYIYLVNVINQFRENKRNNDELGVMREAIKNISKKDVFNVAAYLSTTANR